MVEGTNKCQNDSKTQNAKLLNIIIKHILQFLSHTPYLKFNDLINLQNCGVWIFSEIIELHHQVFFHLRARWVLQSVKHEMICNHHIC
jgi:hypothetical protein